MAFSRKGRAPYLVTPSRVPTIPVEVDWSHPLANGLIACYVPGGVRGGVDLAGIGPLARPNSTASIIGPTSYGPGLVANASGAGMRTTESIPDAWKLTNSGTIFSAFELTGTPVAGTAIIGVVHNSAGTSPFNSYLLSVANSNSFLSFSYNHAGTFGSVTAATVLALGRNTVAATFVTANAQPLILYQNGAVASTTSWVGAAPAYSTTAGVKISGDFTVPARILNGNTAISLMYNRVLTPAEIAQLDREPFCMLRPLRRPVFAKTASPRALAASGTASSRGRGTLSLSVSLVSKGAARSKGTGLLTLSQALSARGASRATGRGALSLFAGVALTGRGAGATRGKGVLSLAMALSATGSARASGRGALLLSTALMARGAAYTKGRGTLSLVSPLALQTVGRGGSGGRGNLTLLLALSGHGAAASSGRGVLTITSTPLALTARGRAASRGRGALALIILHPMSGAGRAVSHGGAAPGGHPGLGVLTLTPFVPAQRVFNIGMPQRGLPIADPKTGMMDQNWYLFFHALWQRGGGPIGN